VAPAAPQASGEQRPNVLFLLSDEHSFRFFSYLSQEEGGEPAYTPTLDRLVGGGEAFDAAYCAMPLCTPSRYCLWTSREQDRCGAWGNDVVLPPDLVTLPAHLANAGYETCLVGKMHFGGSRQFNGFRYRPYGDLLGVDAGHQWDPIARGAQRAGMGNARKLRDTGVTTIPESLLQEQVVARESIAFLREQRYRAPGQPWFLCASFSRPHFPYTAPRRHFERYWPEGATRPRIGRDGDGATHAHSVANREHWGLDTHTAEEIGRARAAYFACVAYLDEMLGDLLACLERDGLLENTIIVYTADHGEMAGEHGLRYKNTFFEASARVPLVVQLPEHRGGARAPARVRTPVSLVDVFPTLCALLDVAPPDGLDGVDLSRAIRSGNAECERGPVLCQYLPDWRMVRNGDHKYVAFADGSELCFDLRTDPDEQRDLVRTGDETEAVEALRRLARDGIGFEEATRRAREERRRLLERYPIKVKGSTPNQRILPDGRVVEGDAILYQPVVLAERAADAFDDWPGMSESEKEES
jgi:choline-sulfatase